MRDRKPIYAYDTIVSLGVATEEKLDTVKKCVGCTWEEVFEFILSVRTYYSSLNEFLEEQGD